LDKKIVEVRLKKLNKVVSRLKQKQCINKDIFINNQDYQDITERNFQIAIQTCIDIANYIIAGANLTVPDDEGNIFLILSKNKIISKALGNKIKGMVGFRNILVHDYLTIEPQQVYEMLQNKLSDFDDFAKAIIYYLEST
jgi:uncharacterized protein YutE (UPF0331/DUF86 family)